MSSSIPREFLNQNLSLGKNSDQMLIFNSKEKTYSVVSSKEQHKGVSSPKTVFNKFRETVESLSQEDLNKMDASEQAFFKRNVNHVNEKISHHNNKVESSLLIKIINFVCWLFTFGKFDYKGSLKIKEIEMNKGFFKPASSDNNNVIEISDYPIDTGALSLKDVAKMSYDTITKEQFVQFYNEATEEQVREIPLWVIAKYRNDIDLNKYGHEIFEKAGMKEQMRNIINTAIDLKKKGDETAPAANSELWAIVGNLAANVDFSKPLQGQLNSTVKDHIVRRIKEYIETDFRKEMLDKMEQFAPNPQNAVLFDVLKNILIYNIEKAGVEMPPVEVSAYELVFNSKEASEKLVRQTAEQLCERVLKTIDWNDINKKGFLDVCDKIGIDNLKRLDLPRLIELYQNMKTLFGMNSAGFNVADMGNNFLSQLTRLGDQFFKGVPGANIAETVLDQVQGIAQAT